MNKKEEQFIKTVWEYYKQNGRHDLPWRKTHDPYCVLVSEMMLQQTQVERVIPKYTAFLKKFSTVQKLAKTSLGDVLILWQGLGYNRRAKMLHSCAQIIAKDYKGSFPNTALELQKLPGIGTYTSGALMAFAFNTPTTLIETNVRSVYLHHFFKDAEAVSDTDILEIIERTSDEKKSREWYYALMDYGSYLKKTHGNPNKKSAHYTKQSAFSGSDRQIRGGIIRALTKKPHTRAALHSVLTSFEDLRVDAQIERLSEEEMVVYAKGKYWLP
jgi:A/G-specific adenine glycosylase